MLDVHDGFINPFGANVNDVLKQSFFLKNGFTGDFAKRKIINLATFLTSDRDMKRTIDLNLAQNLIDLIGEPLIKSNLQRLLDNYINDIMNKSDLTDYAREEYLEFGNNRTKTSLQATVFLLTWSESYILALILQPGLSS